MTIFDALTNTLQEQRQANSVAGTLGPYIGTTGGPSGGVLSQLLGNILGIQSPTPSAPVATAGSSGLAASATSTPPSTLSTLIGASPVTSAPNPAPAPLSYAPTSAPPAAPAPRAPTYAPAPSGPLPSMAAAQGTPQGGLQDMFVNTAQNYGLPQGYLPKLAFIESRLNPNAVNPNSGAAGPYQFIDSTAKQYGLSDPTDWTASTDAAARLTANNAQILQRSLGRAPTQGELYLAHQQGAAGAVQLLMNPNAPATSVVGSKAVTQNGGSPDMTAGQFASMWTSRFGNPGPGSQATAAAGFSTPFNGAPIGPSPNGFSGDAPAGPLPSFAVSGAGMVPQSGGFAQPAVADASSQSASIPSAASGRPAARPQASPVAYADLSTAASAPASQAISAAAPAGDPLVTVPGYPGQWNKAKIAAAPDSADVPEDDELARAQAGAGGAPIGAPQAASAPLAPTRLAAPSPVAAPAPVAAAGGAPAQSGSGLSITPNMIRDLVQNPDTQALGLKLFETAVTTKTPPIVQDGYVLDGRTGQLLYALPQRPQPTDAMKNYGLAQQQGYTGTFMNYQDAQQKADKSTVVEVPLPNGQFQKMAGVAGQPMSTFTPYGAPYTRQPGVNIDQRSETSSEAAYGQAQGKRFGNILDAGEAAQQTQGQLALMNDAFNQSNGQIQTGPFAQSILAGKQAVLGLTGIDLGGIPESEAVQKLGFGLATSLTKEITQRPAQAEFLRALQNVPGIFMSPTGSRVMMSVLNQQAQQKIDLAQLVQDKANRDNWPAVEQAYYASHPLLSPFTGKPLSGQDVMTLAGAANAAGINPETGNSLNASSQTAANLSAARQAIAQGAPRAAVIQKLRQNGVDPSGL